jgi:hypothetical protein
MPSMVPIGDKSLLRGRTSSRRAAYSIKIGVMVQVRKWGSARVPEVDPLVRSSHWNLSFGMWLGYNVRIGSRGEETLCALPGAG